MAGQPIVYVSGTFKDLETLRERVLNSVAAREAAVLAMEYYGASDQVPLDKCVADVRRSHIYVGVIGWNYGFRPGGAGPSITESEFEAATAAKIPRLLYLLSEKLRPKTCADDDPVIAFRERISTSGLVRATFATEADLAEQVTADLIRELAIVREQQVGAQSLLPYLCDRNAQAGAITDEISVYEPARPAVCILQGADNQKPLKFLDCLRQVYLPQSAGNQAAIEYSVPWPEVAAAAVSRALRNSLAGLLAIPTAQKPDALQAALEDKIVGHPGPVLVTIQAPAGALDATEVERLRAITEYFHSWPERLPRKPDVVVICLSYPAPKNGKRSARGQGAQRVKALFAELTTSGTIRVLPELDDIRSNDVAAWLRRPELQRIAAERDLEGDVSRIFIDGQGIPMGDLAPKLLELLRTTPNRSG